MTYAVRSQQRIYPELQQQQPMHIPSQDSTQQRTYPPAPPYYQQPRPPYSQAAFVHPTASYIYSTPVQPAQLSPTAVPEYGDRSMYGDYPQLIICQHCQATVTTTTHYRAGNMVFLLFFMFLMFGCWCGCCLIPFVVDGCRDVVHTCPNCFSRVGKFERLS